MALVASFLVRAAVATRGFGVVATFFAGFSAFAVSGSASAAFGVWATGGFFAAATFTAGAFGAFGPFSTGAGRSGAAATGAAGRGGTAGDFPGDLAGGLPGVFPAGFLGLSGAVSSFGFRVGFLSMVLVLVGSGLTGPARTRRPAEGPKAGPWLPVSGPCPATPG